MIFFLSKQALYKSSFTHLTFNHFTFTKDDKREKKYYNTLSITAKRTHEWL